MLSRRQYGQQCGTITAVNIGIDTGGGNFVWTTRGSENQKCIPGDSGGPVWQPRSGTTSIPAGTVEAHNDTTDRCYFLALDDQMRDIGFTLM